MSKSSRPSRTTTTAKAACSTCREVTPDCKTTNYLVLGSSFAAQYRIARLLNNGVTGQIYHLVEGASRINNNCVSATTFAQTNIRNILQYGIPEQILTTVSSGENDSEIDDFCDTTDTSTVTQWWAGNGVNGDTIFAPYFIRPSSYFLQGINSNRIEQFWKSANLDQPLNTAETQLANEVINEFNIGDSLRNLVVKLPSVLRRIYPGLVENYNGLGNLRQLYSQLADRNYSAPNVTLYSEIVGLTFALQNNGLYNVSALSGLNGIIHDVKVIWATNPFTYLRLATNGGITPQPSLPMPITYRFTIPIPRINNQGINIPTEHGGDLITTFNGFSLHDSKHPKSTYSIDWVFAVYTSDEDLATFDQKGRYAADGYTLLQIDAIHIAGPKRQTTFNIAQQQLISRRAPASQEAQSRAFFLEVVAAVYLIYTGLVFDPLNFDPNTSICTTDGLCSDNITLTTTPDRELPLFTVMNATNLLYPSPNFPNINGKC